MKDSDKIGFVNGLNVMCDCFQVERLNQLVVDRYWNALRDLSVEQFKEICRSLIKSHNKRWSTDFPLPSVFLEAIRPDSFHEDILIRQTEGTTHVSKIIPQLIGMLPQSRKFNTDEEAEIMVEKMDGIIEEAFKDEPLRNAECFQCDDIGYVYVWVQLIKGIRYKGSEILSERVPNSPIWITKFGAENPNEELQLTPCVARCACLIGQRHKENHPAIPSVDSCKTEPIEESYD